MASCLYGRYTRRLPLQLTDSTVPYLVLLRNRCHTDDVVALPDLFFFSFFPCSADHERDWPPCKVVFFGLATNALNVRNNNNNNRCGSTGNENSS